MFRKEIDPNSKTTHIYQTESGHTAIPIWVQQKKSAARCIDLSFQNLHYGVEHTRFLQAVIVMLPGTVEFSVYCHDFATVHLSHLKFPSVVTT